MKNLLHVEKKQKAKPEKDGLKNFQSNLYLKSYINGSKEWYNWR